MYMCVLLVFTSVNNIHSKHIICFTIVYTYLQILMRNVLHVINKLLA